VSEIKEFVERRFSSALDMVKRKRLNEKSPILDIYEETLIYDYTIEGYEQLNEDLRDEKENKYEKYLNLSLDKLPNYKGVVYRGTELSKSQLNRYKQALETEDSIIEKSFTSTSKSILVANQYSCANTIFSIISKTGKDIELYSFYGSLTSQNEKEILFKSKSVFEVLEVYESDQITRITLEEKQIIDE